MSRSLDLRRSIGWREAWLALLILSAAAAFASAQLRLTAWAGLAAAPLLSLKLGRVGEGPRRALPRAMSALLGAALLFGLMWALYPVFSGEIVRLLPRALGGALLALAVIFFVGGSAWDPDRTALPAAMGVLTVAAYDPEARIDAPLGLAAVAVFLYLVRPSARWLRVVAFAAPAVAVAVAIVHGLPWAQPRVEAAAASVLNTGMASSGLSLDSTTRLGDVERLALSRRVVLRVFTPRPQKLRARVFTRFDGARWSAAAGSEARELVEAPVLHAALREWLDGLPGRSFARPGTTAAAAAVTTKVLQLVPTDKVLLAPAGVTLARLADATVRIDDQGLLTPSPGSSVEIYGLLNDPEAGFGEPGPEALAVPADTDPRFRELALRLAEGASPEERVRRTAHHLGRECRYSLDVGRFRSKQPVAEFLFEKKRGYCEYFATAAALLLRLQGVPTRYVSGYNVPGAELSGDHFVVRESDAHAWIEAYLPGRGFVELDPTPSDQYAAVHASDRGGALSGAWQWLQSRWSELMARLRAGDAKAAARFLARRLGAPLVLAALALGAWRFLRRRRSRPLENTRVRAGEGLPPDLARLLTRLDSHWRRQGAPRPASRAPLEHLESLPPGKAGGEAGRRVVATVYRVRFAGAAVAPGDVEALGRLLDEDGIR